jgi:hypothetical protein
MAECQASFIDKETEALGITVLGSQQRCPHVVSCPPITDGSRADMLAATWPWALKLSKEIS